MKLSTAVALRVSQILNQRNISQYRLQKDIVEESGRENSAYSLGLCAYWFYENDEKMQYAMG